MKNKIFVVALIFLLALITVLMVEEKRIKVANEYSVYLKESINNILSLYNESFDNFIQYDHIPIADIDLTNNNGDTEQLIHIISNGKMVIYLPKIECFSCSDKEVEVLNSVFAERERVNVILISNFSSIRELKIFEQNSSIKSYDIQANCKFPSEGLKNKTTLLYISKNMTGSCVFIADKNQNQLSKIYYQAMLKKIEAKSKEWRK